MPATPRKQRSALFTGTLAIAAALLVGVLVKLATEVQGGINHAFDKEIMLALRNPADLSDPIGPGWFEELMRDFTALGGNGFLTVLTALVLLVTMVEGRRREAMIFLGSVIAALVLGKLMKLGFDRPRPDLVPHHTQVYTSSFPSSHAGMAAAIYLSLAAMVVEWPARRAIRSMAIAVGILFTLVVGASRVYLGVHWPTDVIAGWSFGTACALICWLALVRLHHGPTPPAEG
jgi:undecaprenyl-diphosphatase